MTFRLRQLRGLLASFATVALVACHRPPSPPSPCRGTADPTGIAFEDGSERAGLPATGIGYCTVIGDLDRDGHEDLLFVESRAVKVSWGHGDFSFTAATVAELLFAPSGCAVVDLDGNGLRDIVFGGPDPTVLRHEQARQFAPTPTSLPGPFDDEYGAGLAAADFDRDGWVDLFSARRKLPLEQGLTCETALEDFRCELAAHLPSSPDLVLRNEGGGVFSDASATLLGEAGVGFGAGTADFNGDGYVDLLVANDYARNELHLGGASGFTESAVAQGLGAYNHGMGVAIADFNLDGHWDVYVTDIGPDGLFYGSADAHFTPAGSSSRLQRPQADRWAWGVAAQDFDNDGDVDVFTGVSYRTRSGAMEAALEDFLSTGNRERSTLYASEEQGDELVENCGDGSFLSRTLPIAVASSRLRQPNPVAAGDLDGDGRIDLFVRGDRSLQFGGRPRLWRNTTASARHFLGVDLRGKGGNTDALGAEVWVLAGERRQRRQVQVGSAGGHGSLRLHFGLEGGGPVSVEIRWPDGTTSTLEAVAVDQVLAVQQP